MAKRKNHIPSILLYYRCSCNGGMAKYLLPEEKYIKQLLVGDVMVCCHCGKEIVEGLHVDTMKNVANEVRDMLRDNQSTPNGD